VRAPQGEAGVVFAAGRVVSGYIWAAAVPRLPPPGASGREQQIRDGIAAILDQLVRLREGEFAFNLTEQVPTRLGGRDLSEDMLADGINPEELMLDLARKLDEDRRECAATLEASFSVPAPEEGPPEPPFGAAEAGGERRGARWCCYRRRADCRSRAPNSTRPATRYRGRQRGHARREMLQLAFEQRFIWSSTSPPSENGTSTAGLDVCGRRPASRRRRRCC
jgi:hypothetical protein